jgi:hypothetical protein
VDLGVYGSLQKLSHIPEIKDKSFYEKEGDKYVKIINKHAYFQNYEPDNPIYIVTGDELEELKK